MLYQSIMANFFFKKQVVYTADFIREWLVMEQVW